MRNFFDHIRLKYDVETCVLLKKYCRETKKLAKQSERLKYLLICRKNGLTPTHLVNSTKNTRNLFTSTKISQELYKIEQKFHAKIVNLEIKETNFNIREIRKYKTNIERELMSILNKEEFDNFLKRQKDRYKKIISTDRLTHAAKIQNLKRKQLQTYNLTFNPSWFINNTDVVFPDESKWLLSLGSKFALPVNSNNFSAINLIADLEEWVQTQTDDREKEVIRSKIANRILTHKRTAKNSPKEKFILNIYEETKRFLKRYKEKIVITKSDKGNKTVILYKEEYQRKMQNLLEDKSTYKTIRVDPTQKLQRTNNRMIMELYKQEHITKYEKFKLSSNSATAPRLYGLPKVHKPDMPLRPISSSVEVPCYNLSKYIGNILKNIILEKYNIKNSLELKNKLKDITLDNDEILISLDVISLFTNIPIHLAINNIMTRWNIIQQHTQIPRTQFLKILQFCLNENNYFIYGDTFYSQTYGMPMGNPLSPTIADIVLDTLLDQAIQELSENGVQIKLITKYVDDLFAIIRKKDEELILRTFNRYHNKIKFTIEIEENNSLAYLDMKIHKNNKNLETDWYTKTMASGRIMNYNSTQPQKQKINTASNLIKTALQLSDDKFKNKNINKVKDILLKNSYPNNIINNLIKKATTENPENSNINNTSGSTKKFYSLSYIPGLTDRKQLEEIINYEEASLAHKPNKTINALFTQTKTRVEKGEQGSVVYEIKCVGKPNESCDDVYIGTTKRSLNTRIAEHEADIRNNKQSTALAQHCLEKGHNADLNNVKILDKERRENKRLTLESLRIQQKQQRAMNKKDDIDNINANYTIAII